MKEIFDKIKTDFAEKIHTYVQGNYPNAEGSECFENDLIISTMSATNVIKICKALQGSTPRVRITDSDKLLIMSVIRYVKYRELSLCQK